MKRIALSLLAAAAAVVVATPAQAIVGGPFDNNLFYSPTLNGTFQGTASGKNLAAIMIFSIGENFTAGGTGTGTSPRFPNMGEMATFYKGKVFRSGVEAVPNASTRKIAAVIFTRDSSTPALNGFMDAKFDNIHPSITYKGKADVAIKMSSNTSDEELKLRVRGIKTANGSTTSWIWN